MENLSFAVLFYISLGITVIFVLMFMVIYCALNLKNLEITYKQEFSAEDRKLLEDIYNSEGEYSSKELELRQSFDELVRNINNIMLDMEDDSNG